jgi:hypothetical protein
VSEENKRMLGEFKAITSMIKRAEKEGLVVEVVWSFSQELKAGKSCIEAASNAAYEWDL